MRSVFLICRKELNSYFASPIAYLLMAFFALIFGFVLFNATRDFIRYSFQMQFQGGGGPMSINDQIITPLLGFTSTITLFLVPLITMRLFAEESAPAPSSCCSPRRSPISRSSWASSSAPWRSTASCSPSR